MVKICVAQLKSKPNKEGHNLEQLQQCAKWASSQGCKLLITPELFIHGYTEIVRLTNNRQLRDKCVDLSWEAECQTGSILHRLCEIARQNGMDIVTGVMRTEATQFRNSSVWISADKNPDNRQLRAVYDKCHLWQSEHRIFTAGDQPCVTVDAFGLRFALLICYDMDFPEQSRVAALSGADCLLCITASKVSPLPVSDLLVPARAVENECFAVYCNYAGTLGDSKDYFGRSTVIARTGHVIQQSGVDPCLLIADLDPQPSPQQTCPYIRDRRPRIYSKITGSKL